MYAEERQADIAARIDRQGRASVSELAREFELTTETIRRDLAVLEQRGLVRRVHGGATSSSGNSLAEFSVDDRRVQDTEQKQRIAAAAVSLVPAEGSSIIDAGTTTECLADELARSTGRDGLTAITNAVPVAYRLGESTDIGVHLLGGTVRGLTRAAVGESTVDELRRLRPDVAFVGVNGIHAEFGLSTPDLGEGAVKRAIVSAARRVVVLADDSKFDRESLVSFADLGEIDVLVTCAAPGDELAEALENAGVEVIIA